MQTKKNPRIRRLRPEFRTLRLRQLDRSTSTPLASVERPAKGWIRTVRQALGVSSGELARRMGTSRQLPLQLEKGESEDRITLRSLRAVANALDCDLVYAFVPRSSTFEELIDKRVREDAEKRVLAVQHSMALEQQAVSQAAMDHAMEQAGKRKPGK